MRTSASSLRSTSQRTHILGTIATPMPICTKRLLLSIVGISAGAPAFEFAGARSFVVFEGAGFRFSEAPELPPKKNEKRWKKIHIVKFGWNQKSARFIRRGG
jgi:hypothetical protein